MPRKISKSHALLLSEAVVNVSLYFFIEIIFMSFSSSLREKHIKHTHIYHWKSLSEHYYITIKN